MSGKFIRKCGVPKVPGVLRVIIVKTPGTPHFSYIIPEYIRFLLFLPWWAYQD